MDTIQSQLKTINCTECSAPLDLHGGRQVKSISCPYCGAVLDNKDEYKVLQQYSLKDRPKTPLKIGEKGVLNDVKFTIIGFIGYECEGDKWVEYQLFSPTHGYAWLSYAEEEGFVFGHKVRYYPETYSKQKNSSFRLNNKTFKVKEACTAHIFYVEGELTWIARKNDTVNIIEATSGNKTYSIENSHEEQEYSLGESLPTKTVYKAFGHAAPSGMSKNLFSQSRTNSSSKSTSDSVTDMIANIIIAGIIGIPILFILYLIFVPNNLKSSGSSSIRNGSTYNRSSSSSNSSSSSYRGGK